MYSSCSSFCEYTQLLTEYNLGRPIIRQDLKMRIWGVPLAVGHYCSYLLPKQTGGTTQILVFETLRMIDRPALYCQESLKFQKKMVHE